MTVLSAASSIPYVGNGVTTVFPVPFEYLDAEDLEVTLTSNGVDTVLSPSAYTATPGGLGKTGTVTLTTPPTMGVAVTIRRQMDVVQPDDWRTQGRFTPDAVEIGLDRLTMLIQQHLRGHAELLYPAGLLGMQGCAYQAVNASILSAAFGNAIAFGVRQFDDGLVFNGGTGQLSAPATGRYQIRARVTLGALKSNDAFRLKLMKGATVLDLGGAAPAIFPSAADGDFTATAELSTLVALMQGDLVTIVPELQTDVASVNVIGAATRFEALWVS